MGHLSTLCPNCSSYPVKLDMIVNSDLEKDLIGAKEYLRGRSGVVRFECICGCRGEFTVPSDSVDSWAFAVSNHRSEFAYPPRGTALDLARRAHAGQMDKIGQPYFQHVLRVAKNVLFHGASYRDAALLHDVVEDTELTLDDLRSEGILEEVVLAVDALTRREEENYQDYIIRCGRNKIAKTVKVYDLEDNLSPARLSGLTWKEQISMTKRYQRSLDYLRTFGLVTDN